MKSAEQFISNWTWLPFNAVECNILVAFKIMYYHEVKVIYFLWLLVNIFLRSSLSLKEVSHFREWCPETRVWPNGWHEFTATAATTTAAASSAAAATACTARHEASDDKQTRGRWSVVEVISTNCFWDQLCHIVKLVLFWIKWFYQWFKYFIGWSTRTHRYVWV